jgi:hypothetical protein
VRRAQNSADLRTEDVRSIEAETDAALPEERIRFRRHRQVRKRFVATNVERSDHENALGTKGAGDGLVDADLLVFVRRRAAVHEDELGPEQANTFTANFGNAARFLLITDVGHDLDAPAVTRDGRFARDGQLNGPLLLGGCLPAPYLGLFGGGRREPLRTGVAV